MQISCLNKESADDYKNDATFFFSLEPRFHGYLYSKNERLIISIPPFQGRQIGWMIGTLLFFDKYTRGLKNEKCRSQASVTQQTRGTCENTFF
jgi:hypothetical protein